MQCLAEDGDQLGGLDVGDTALAKSGSQVAAIHVFGHDVTPAVLGAAHVEDRHDVRVGQPGDDPGFLEIGLDVQEPGRLEVEGDLDGNVAVELGVLSQVDPTEPTLAEDPDHTVSANVSRSRFRSFWHSISDRLSRSGSAQGWVIRDNFRFGRFLFGRELHERVQPLLPVDPVSQCFQQRGIVDADRIRNCVPVAVVTFLPLLEEVEEPVFRVIFRRGRCLADIELGLSDGLRVDFRGRYGSAVHLDTGAGLSDEVRLRLGVDIRRPRRDSIDLVAGLELGRGL